MSSSAFFFEPVSATRFSTDMSPESSTSMVFFSRRVLARLLLFARHARGRRGLGVLLDADASRGRSSLRRAPGGPSVAGRENPGGAFEPLEHHEDDQRSFFGPGAGRSASEKLTSSHAPARLVAS